MFEQEPGRVLVEIHFQAPIIQKTQLDHVTIGLTVARVCEIVRLMQGKIDYVVGRFKFELKRRECLNKQI